MAQKYTKKEFWKLYKKLPQELKDALFAEETGDSIYDVCKRNNVLENFEKIVEYTGHVLIGVLPPNEFQETIEQKLGLKKDIAKKVTQEINRFIFFPAKRSLGDLYSTEIAPPAQMKIPTQKAEKKATASKRKDTYREPVEE